MALEYYDRVLYTNAASQVARVWMPYIDSEADVLLADIQDHAFALQHNNRSGSSPDEKDLLDSYGFVDIRYGAIDIHRRIRDPVFKFARYVDTAHLKDRFTGDLLRLEHETCGHFTPASAANPRQLVVDPDSLQRGVKSTCDYKDKLADHVFHTHPRQGRAMPSDNDYAGFFLNGNKTSTIVTAWGAWTIVANPSQVNAERFPRTKATAAIIKDEVRRYVTAMARAAADPEDEERSISYAKLAQDNEKLKLVMKVRDHLNRDELSRFGMYVHFREWESINNGNQYYLRITTDDPA